MPTQRRNIIVSILFVVFGGPGIVVLYLPLWITHFHQLSHFEMRQSIIN